MSATVPKSVRFRRDGTHSEILVGRDQSWESWGDRYQVCVIAASAGGFKAVRSILAGLPESFPLPIVLAQHRSAGNDSLYADLLRYKSRMRVEIASQREALRPGTLYVPPSGSHMTIETDCRLSIALGL